MQCSNAAVGQWLYVGHASSQASVSNICSYASSRHCFCAHYAMHRCSTAFCKLFADKLCLSHLDATCAKALWTGTVPGLLLTIPYTAVQFVALHQCKEAAAKLGWEGVWHTAETPLQLATQQSQVCMSSIVAWTPYAGMQPSTCCCWGCLLIVISASTFPSASCNAPGSTSWPWESDSDHAVVAVS